MQFADALVQRFVSSSAILDGETDSGAKKDVLDDTDLFSRHILSYELGALQRSLAKADGQPVKTTKSNLLHLLEKSAPSPFDVPPNAPLVLDFMAVLRSTVNVGNIFASLAYHQPMKPIMANVVSGSCVYFAIDQYPKTLSFC